jgi:hypothetical protein
MSHRLLAPSYPASPTGDTNVDATWALYLALATTVTCSITAVPSLVLALRALRRCARQPGQHRDASAAWAALALSIVSFVAMAMVRTT